MQTSHEICLHFEKIYAFPAQVSHTLEVWDTEASIIFVANAGFFIRNILPHSPKRGQGWAECEQGRNHGGSLLADSRIRLF